MIRGRIAGGLRGVASVLGVFALFAACGLYQRLVLAPWCWLRPAGRRERVGAYMRWVAARVIGFMELGGARFERHGFVPTDEPTLIVMNHQSLLDVPTAVLMSGPAAVRFVTRERYARFVPLVSPLLRLSEAPIVEPERSPREAVAQLAAVAASLESALLIYPEGGRTRDGSLRRFHRAGLRAMLKERRLPVHVIVTDGLWACRTLADFFFHVSRVRGRTEVIGRFEPPEDPEGLNGFLDDLHGRMERHLEQMRGGERG